MSRTAMGKQSIFAFCVFFGSSGFIRRRKLKNEEKKSLRLPTEETFTFGNKNLGIGSIIMSFNYWRGITMMSKSN
jgi:hypothetical protein